MDEKLVDKEYLLEKLPGKYGWTYTIIPEIRPDPNAPFNWVKVRGTIDEVLQTGEISVGELQTARRLSRLLDAFYNTPAWQELTRELILNDRRFLYRFLAYLTEANLIDQPMSLERRGLVLYEYCKQYYPDYRTQASIAWIEAGMRFY